jgi:endonuclease-3
MRHRRSAVFLDRDGVINENRADYVTNWEEFVFLPGVFEPLRRLAQSGLLTIVVTNQSAIHRGLVSQETVEAIHRQMRERISRSGGRIDAVFTCPHRPDEPCRCRKPEPGLLLQAAERFDLDLPRCYLIGDALSDIAAGLAVGCCPILVLTGKGREELPRLIKEGYSGYHVTADLMEAVEWIVGRDKALEVHRRLGEAYGEPRRSHLDPISELVSTILSQNTNDALRDRAFDRLRRRFPSWEQVRDAPVGEIVEAIQTAGLSRQKAPRIQAALQRITRERGELSLDFLREMEVEEAKQWLTSIQGVGPKSAAIVLLFALERPAFPVDTHVHRVTKRLGLIPPQASREKAHEILEALMPPETYYAFHLHLIRHGREVCRARTPRCEACRLRDLCDEYVRFT